MSVYTVSPRPWDVHCHFFNREILSLRLLIDLVMLLKKKEQQNPDSIDGLSSQLKRILHFIKMGMLPVEELWKSLEKDEPDFAFCPLMFDLEGCMISAKTEQGMLKKEIIRQLEEELVPLLDKYFPEDESYRELKICLLNAEDRPEQLYDHFAGQEKQVVDLTGQYPDRIFPFFAVDPRRRELFDDPEHQQGIGKIVSRLRINGGVFSGIKLYTPNGYSPMDRRLLALYEYCQEHQVPVTAHCSAGGFATFASAIDVDGWIYDKGDVVEKRGVYKFRNNGLFDSERVTERAMVLNHPKIWGEVLSYYPKLKLNLAHFGSQDSGKQKEWTDCIFRMMHEYPDLYTDFSCITDKSELQMMYSKYFQRAEERMKSRFLYGSDFYLNLLFCDDMKSYRRNFSELFSEQDWNRIAVENPGRFLSIF